MKQFSGLEKVLCVNVPLTGSSLKLYGNWMNSGARNLISNNKTVLLYLSTVCRVLETTSNAASSVHSKKSKNKHLAEAEKQKAEAEVKAAKEREQVLQ